MNLLHFTAAWAEQSCAPHRIEVSAAAVTLGCDVREVDVDAEPEQARAYGVLNVPAVAVEGQPELGALVGARSSTELVAALSARLM